MARTAKLANGMTLDELVDAVEPLVETTEGETDLRDWIKSGAELGGIHRKTTPQDIADEWNELTTQAHNG